MAPQNTFADFSWGQPYYIWYNVPVEELFLVGGFAQNKTSIPSLVNAVPALPVKPKLVRADMLCLSAHS